MCVNHSLQDTVCAVLRKHHVADAAPVLIACSGGPDSVVLAHLLYTCGYAVGLAHVNYGLRAHQSNEEEAIVRQLAANWGVPIFVLHPDTHAEIVRCQKPLQVVAREIRYAFFAEIMQTQGYTHCATAHHIDDHAETILHALLRENAPRILHGIPETRQAYIRPLLSVPKRDILAYAASQQLPYGIDSSNLKTDYTRNKIRHKVLPSLLEVNPSAVAQLAAKEAKYALQYSFLQQILATYAHQCFSLTASGGVLQWSAFEAQFGAGYVPLLVEYVCAQQSLHGNDIAAVVQLCEARHGARAFTRIGEWQRIADGLSFSSTHIIFPKKALTITRIASAITYYQYLCLWEISWLNAEDAAACIAQVQAGHFTVPPNVFYIDADKLHFPLTLRTWQQGDSMRPIGMRGNKLLSDIFTDNKYLPEQKRNAVVLADTEGVIALTDFRIAERVKLTPQTRKIVCVRIVQPNTHA